MSKKKQIINQMRKKRETEKTHNNIGLSVNSIERLTRLNFLFSTHVTHSFSLSFSLFSTSPCTLHYTLFLSFFFLYCSVFVFLLSFSLDFSLTRLQLYLHLAFIACRIARTFAHAHLFCHEFTS